MKYAHIQEGVFLSRPNQFTAHVKIDDKPVVAYIKNTSRCKELLVPGAKIILQKSENSERKTPFTPMAC